MLTRRQIALIILFGVLITAPQWIDGINIISYHINEWLNGVEEVNITIPAQAIHALIILLFLTVIYWIAFKPDRPA